MLGIFSSSYTTVSKGEESKGNALVAGDSETENNVQGDFENRSRGSSNSSAARSDSFVGRERTMTFSPAVPENSPTVLTFSNIVVQTKTDPPKVLLNNLSGAITGGFWAIMGSSGSGKTLLLSTLSLRLDSTFMDIKGEIRLNGREFSRHTLKAMSAYVMQEDLLHAELTVQETLSYAARLRMARDTTPEERENRISEVLGLLGISHTRTVIIGNTRRKGVSGGERKRVSIAVELLNYPKLVFLDEPTTGLDSTTSLSVCEALKNFTVKGDCTVVCTIHQPQPKIFDLFDNLILLKQGNMVYHGSARKTERFLQQMGLPCPADLAIADHLLDVISPTNDNDEVLNRTAAKRIVPVDLSLGKEKGSFDDLGARSWFVQFSILFQRNMHQYFRNSDIIVMNLLVTSLLAIFIGSGLWYHIGTGQDSIAKRVPSLFFCCVTQGMVGSLQAINSFPAERAIMLRERQAGTYRVSAYFMAKSAVDLLTALWPPIIFTCIVYFMIGYQKRADKFFMFMFFMVLNALAPTSAATAVSCFCGSVDVSVVVLSTVLEGCRLFGGFFASPAQIDDIPKWRFADALSYIKYAFVGVALNELSDLDIECNNPSGCAITSGQQIIKANGYDEYSIGFCIGILFVLIVGSRFLAYLGLRYIK